VKKGNIPDPFGRYAVALDFETARATSSEPSPKEDFINNPLVLARVGTPEYLEDFYENSTNCCDREAGNVHRLGGIDYHQPQGLFLLMYSSGIGSTVNNSLDTIGHFVGVARQS
ncbi:MAG: hypothetical protein NTZ02_00070, partial [Candidatus Woesearchaeota archaeon]|nr:hypothetical protein [Candidatus Woesearchaeota archaeon]